MADGKRRMRTETDRNRETEEDGTCCFVFCCKQISLTAGSSLCFDSLTLEPQFAVWIRRHCLKRTVSVRETSLTKLHCGGSCPPTCWAHTHHHCLNTLNPLTCLTSVFYNQLFFVKGYFEPHEAKYVFILTHFRRHHTQNK